MTASDPIKSLSKTLARRGPSTYTAGGRADRPDGGASHPPDWHDGGQLRDELLKGEIFYTLQEAKVIIEGWRRHYNTVRPHSSLCYRPPAPEVLVAPSRLARRPTLN